MDIPRVLVPLLGGLGLVSCVSLPPSNHQLSEVESALTESHAVFSDVVADLASNSRASRKTQVEREIRSAELLQQPLQLNDLLELWLLNSPQLVAELAELGIARAQQVQAGLLSNPTLAVAALRPEGGGRWQWELGISQSLLDVLTRPLRMQLAGSALTAAQLKLYDVLNQHLFQIQHQYLAAVAARQLQQLQEARLQAAEASLVLASSLYEAGNMAEADWLVQRLGLQSEQRESTQAALAAQQADIKLKQLVGLPAADLYLPKALPPLPAATEWKLDQLLTNALAIRPDVLLARENRQTSLRQQAVVHKYRGMATLELGAYLERETNGEQKIGPELAVSLPVFDRGQAQALAAESALARDQALVRARELEVEAELAAALAALNQAHGRVTSIQQESLPLNRQLQALRLREYNYMLTSPFVLLELKQAEFALQQEAVLALRDYWQAHSDLSRAHGRNLEPPPSGKPVPRTEEPIHDPRRNPGTAGDHHHD